MKKRALILLIVAFLFQTTTAQLYNSDKLLAEYNKYDVILKYENDFNNDNILDVLYILSLKSENNESLINNNDSVSKRKAVIYLGKNNKTFFKTIDNDNIFPCRECLGKSDNFVSDLKFENNILSYTTTIATFASNNYSVIDFTLQFTNNNFTIYNYKEIYSSVEKDDVIIDLNNRDIPKMNFNYYDWIADKSWIDYILVTDKNITKLNDFAHQLEDINPSISINLLQKIIVKYPTRVVAYLNLADSFWNDGDRKSAKENYQKYISLMKTQNKDLKKIPKEVWERVK